MTDITNKTIWLTGASAGIGEALAYALAAQDARLILSARRREQLEAVCSRCANPERHLIIPFDMGDPAAVQAAVGQVRQMGRTVDLLINNAGLSQRALAQDTALEVDRRLMEVNFFGAVALTKALLPEMLARRSGHIVTVTSLVGIFGSPVRSGYAASKHALHGFYDSLRAEVAPGGVVVTLICPGFIRTEVSVHALMGNGTPQGTMDGAQAAGMAPEQCAAAILAAIRHNRAEVVIGGRETWGVWISRWFPSLFRRLIGRVNVTRPV
jgi:dehydrogenase/reductase SDR family member 7B